MCYNLGFIIKYIAWNPSLYPWYTWCCPQCTWGILCKNGSLLQLVKYEKMSVIVKPRERIQIHRMLGRQSRHHELEFCWGLHTMLLHAVLCVAPLLWAQWPIYRLAHHEKVSLSLLFHPVKNMHAFWDDPVISSINRTIMHCFVYNGSDECAMDEEFK